MQKYKINNTYIIKRMINYETEIDIYESRREDKEKATSRLHGVWAPGGVVAAEDPQKEQAARAPHRGSPAQGSSAGKRCSHRIWL